MVKEKYKEPDREAGWLGYVTLWRKYPRAHENRIRINDPSLRKTRLAFLKAATKNFLLLQILFLGLFAYIFGALYKQDDYVHNLNVVYVDYDGGLVGASIRNAYQALQADTFPTLMEHTASDYPTPDDLREAVCRTRFWGAIFTSPGASARIENAIATGSTNYNKNDAVSYLWNEARYPTVVDSAISSNLQALSSAARIDFANNNWTSTIQSPSDATISLFANPWQLTSINIMITAQGSRLIYNTLVIILILIQEFFYLGTINSLYDAFKIYPRLNPHRIIVFRLAISLAYTFIGSLCVAGAIWAFKTNWDVNGNQFVLTWIILWLFAHVNFLTFDVFTIWLPPPYVPMSLIAWIVMNVTSILLPFELSPGFYSYGYVYPAHEVYQILLDIWSRGCNPDLRYALPVLFALEISGLFISALGVHRRCHYAVIKEEIEKNAFQTRLDNALAFEQQKLSEDRRASVKEGELGDVKTNEEEQIEVERDRKDLTQAMMKGDEELKRAQSNAAKAVNFGPSFGFSFGQNDDAEQ